MPPAEQVAFARRLRQWRAAPTSPQPVARARQWPDFLARLRSIYGHKTTGDSQSLISELRGGR